MPVSPDAGKLMYSLVRATRPETVVEFGMSSGLSGITSPPRCGTTAAVEWSQPS